MSATPLLEATDLTKLYRIGGGLVGAGQTVHALTDVSLALFAGETLAVVGESGCGKTTLARCLAQLIEPTSGSIRLDGEDVAAILRSDPLRFRRRVQIVFQDPYASLNPRRTVFQSVADPLRIHRICPAEARRERASALLDRVGLSSDYLDRYPHELSGGQRQRVAIARALAVGPSLVICDEPVSALDVSIQAQVINLLKDLQQALGIAYVFISHNLALVRHISDRIAVMYLGQVVELGTTAAFRRVALHPYSRALFAAAPKIGAPRDARDRRVDGDVPNPIALPPGCRFSDRCPMRQERCRTEAPELRTMADRLVRCHFAESAMGPSGVRAAPSD
jgi:oligopeptide/dipeptide ABC transporter ATP-binding protein